MSTNLWICSVVTTVEPWFTPASNRLFLVFTVTWKSDITATVLSPALLQPSITYSPKPSNNPLPLMPSSRDLKYTFFNLPTINHCCKSFTPLRRWRPTAVVSGISMKVMGLPAKRGDLMRLALGHHRWPLTSGVDQLTSQSYLTWPAVFIWHSYWYQECDP